MDTSDQSSHRSSLTTRHPGLLPSPLLREAAAATTSPEASRGSHAPPTTTATGAVTDAITHAEHVTSEALDEGSDGAASLRPAFASFYTLVEDARTATTTHPAVRYIFSDDDSDVLTDALLRLNAQQGPLLSAGGAGASDRTVGAGGSAAGMSRERAIVVTLGADGRSVVAAHSLTPDWQVLGAEVAAAPTLEGEEGETGGLMLRVQGTEGFRADASASAVLEGGMEGAVERFRERMEELRRVVEAGQRTGGTDTGTGIGGAVGLS